MVIKAKQFILCLAGLLVFSSSVVCAAGLKPFSHQGIRVIRLDELASFYGGEMIPTPTSEKVFIRTRLADLTFKPDSREVLIGTAMVFLHEPMMRARGSWVISEVDALTLIDPVMRPGEYLKKTGHRVVVLDPGHGAEDSGAKGRQGAEEKRVVLDISRRVRAHLAAAGVVVYMTRENDRFIALEQRAELAKRWGADLFVSIHANSAAARTAKGVECFILSAEGFTSTSGGQRGSRNYGNSHDAANAVLGFQVHRALVKQSNAPDRGLKRARFIVLRNAPCPAVLVECGFLSNAEEERKVMTPEYRDELARGIARGIINYVTLARNAQKRVTP
jgi:N-acetylmuramoyl-L-alanine amidase